MSAARRASGWLGLALTLGLATPAAARPLSCPEDAPAASVAQLDATLDAAELAWRDLSSNNFAWTLRLAEQQLGCLDELVEPAVAARVHRLFGLLAFAEDEGAGAERDLLRAARVLSPSYAFPEDLLGSSEAPARLYVSLSATEGPLAPAAEGHAWVYDGAGEQRPLDRATLAQRLGPDGAPVQSVLLLPAEALPAETPPTDSAPTPAQPIVPLPEPAAPLQEAGSPWLRRGALIALGVAGGAGAALLYREGLQAEAAFNALEPGETEALDAMERKANLLATGSALSYGVAVGAGVTLMLRW